MDTVDEYCSFELLGCEKREKATKVVRKGCEFNKGPLEAVREVEVVLFLFSLVFAVIRGT